MKKLASLALTAALAGSLAVPALAAETPVLISAPVDFATQITLNGEAVDTAGIPAAAEGLLPMRLLAEADHGSAYWDEENNEGWFYFGDNRVVIKFADNSVTVNDVAVDVDAVDVIAGVTYMSADVFEGWEGYTVAWGDPTAEGFQSVSITTPNNDPAVKLAYEIQELCSMGFGMQADEQTLTDAYGVPAGSFEQVAAFFPMITSPDTVIIGKLAEGADQAAVEAALETYRQGQEDTFSWYLSQNLPKVQDARLVVENGWLLFLIADNADAGVEAFQAFVGAQG